MVQPQKIDLVSQISEKLRESQSVIFADFRGLTVEEMTDVRRKLRERKVEFKVLKNRLGKLALAEAGCEAVDDILLGNTAWAFGVSDPVAPAKVLSDFAKEHAKMVIKGGLLDKKRVDLATIQELAALPSRDELLGIMAVIVSQPATRLAMAMEAAITKIARGFSALAEKMEEEGAPT